MITQNFNTMPEIREAYFNKLKDQLFGLLCEYEKGRDWSKFLDAILIEVYDWPEEWRSINYIRFCAKLGSCRYLSYEYFRKTIFDCMTLLGLVYEQL